MKIANLKITMYIRAKETFISAEKTQIYLGKNGAARISGGGPTPTVKASTRPKGMRMVGLHLRAQTCGPDGKCVRSEMGFGYVDLPPNPVGFAAVCQ